VKSDKIEEFKAAHRPVWAACAKEPECLFFDLFHDKENNTFRFVEVWSKDKEWFEEEQMTKSYYAEMWPKSQPLWEGESKIEYYERDGEACIFRQDYLDGGRKVD
jgi:quinol monooxygenase YgiN